MLKRLNKPLILIFLLALVLREVGINHDLPFVFHPDEPSIIRTALGMRFDLNPHHFDWPHLYFYINYFMYIVFARVRNLFEVLGFKSALGILWNDGQIFYLLTRALSALLGALTVFFIYLTGKEIFNKKVGLVSALVFALIPFHVLDSHNALIDVPMVFFLSISLYFCAKIYNSADSKNYLLAGIFAGFASSTKYNGGLVVISIVLAHFLRRINLKQSLFDKKGIFLLFTAGILFLVAFFAGSPYALFDYKTFLRTDGPNGAFWQFTNVGKVSFIIHLKQFYISISDKLVGDFGYTFFYLFLIGSILTFLRIIKGDFGKLLFLLIPAWFFIFYISGFEKYRSHYFIIAFPYIAILGSYYLVLLNEFLSKRYTRSATLIFLMALAVPLIMSLLVDYAYLHDDTRSTLYKWLQLHATPADKLFYTNSDLGLVMQKFRKQSDKLINYDSLVNNSGYIISEDGNYDWFAQTNLASVTKVLIISSRLKNGPQINVYSLKK
ncbi:MAG TPA: glycosyltransferase family 39 protein [Candidatus Saccharimonadales bacterium]|nr:glycosyltransferase family 39 protein [Candidatus Saccharimonadales bacterium]